MPCAALSVAAEKAGGSAASYLATRQFCARNTVPVNPSAEGIYHRNAIFEHQRPAGTAGTQPAKGYSLCGGICYAATGTAEQRKPWELTQHVIYRKGRVSLQIHWRKLHHTAGNFREVYFRSGCCNYN